MSPLVSGGWLAAHLESVVVADVRWSLGQGPRRHDYEAGHIPGAVFVDLDADLAGPPSPGMGRHPLPEPKVFARRMGALGISETTPVVAYDDAAGSVAARLWWLLHTLGAPVAVLDGGLAAFRGPLEYGPVAPTPRQRAVQPWPDERFLDSAGVEDARSRPLDLVLDARSTSRFEFGDLGIDPRPGHIPGARSAPWTANLQHPNGPLLSPAALQQRFAGLGVDQMERVVAYCGSGVTACHDLLALDVAGFHHTALYPGSWSAWGADPHRPVATGHE